MHWSIVEGSIHWNKAPSSRCFMLQQGILCMHPYCLKRICGKLWVLQNERMPQTFKFTETHQSQLHRKGKFSKTYNARFRCALERGADLPSPIVPGLVCDFTAPTADLSADSAIVKDGTAISLSRVARADWRSSNVSPASCSLAFLFTRRS